MAKHLMSLPYPPRPLPCTASRSQVASNIVEYIDEDKDVEEYMKEVLDNSEEIKVVGIINQKYNDITIIGYNENVKKESLESLNTLQSLTNLTLPVLS